MSFYMTMLPVLLTAVTLLMAGILVGREHKQDSGAVLMESLVWGVGFFVAFSLEILAFASI